jgi:hypothetical protein
MTVELGLLVLLDAKPGEGAELSAFLESGRTLAVAETGTVTWYAFKVSDTSSVFSTRSRPRRPARRTSTVRSLRVSSV